MNLSIEALESFVHAASSGSFSAAARGLGKSQSTISETIARIEIELDVELFVRGARQLTLTEPGRSLLGYALETLSAIDRLKRHAATLGRGQEAKLTLVLSDTYQQSQYEARLHELDQRYPDLEFECFFAEQADVLDLINQGRANLGLLAAQPEYGPDIAHSRLPYYSSFGLFVSQGHALSQKAVVEPQDLAHYRMLRLSSVVSSDLDDSTLPVHSTRCWSTPDYLLLLEMAALGFGWAALPKGLVESHAQGRVHELVMNGWPKQVSVDVVWSRKQPLGPAAAWLLERLTQTNRS
ncbi:MULTISPECIES: LysR family transcriptional regulator [Pseudomonas]|uniref:LysR family transcriptional regulator n=1 Tax=Pseudomonas TaxID=286 RepID=UPI0025AFB5E9|nr:MULTISPECIES: LysR family transcriptional regulator [unclassified Pseudomonas]MDN3237584.1 LysR family transcriptional regulator [Pseudomonas sp. WAC2]